MKINKLFICSALLICMLLVSCSACKSPAPELESVKESLIEKIEASYEINDIFWGEGLPVVKIGSGESMDRNLYNDKNDIEIDDDGFWEYVHPENSKYHSVLEIKELAEKVYSRKFLESVYQSQFEGVESATYTGRGDPHYTEYNSMLWKSTGLVESFKLIESKRLYKYDTMKLESKSSKERLYVSIESYFEGKDETERITLTFDLQGGEYFLSSPTY